jgi:hypothetical protein
VEELFPGLTAGLTDQGASVGDLLATCRWYLNGHRLQQTATGLTGLSARRPQLEGAIRARLLSRPNVTLLEDCDIVGITSTPDLRRVTGARMLRRTDGSAVEELTADLVVDATGRSSRTPVWLPALGYRPPAAERIGIRAGCATRTYRLTPDALGGDRLIVNGATREHLRGGILQLVDGDRAMVTLSGRLGDFPPTDPDGFLSFARSLQFSDIYQAIRDAEPLDDPVAFRFPASVRRRYERLRRLPTGLLVTGDAVCSFNPQYGQGMSVAALEALVLRTELTGGEPDPRRFFHHIAQVIDGPWNISAGTDLAFPGVQGTRTIKTQLVNRYVARLHAAAEADPTVARAFIRVAALVDRPESLLRPAIAVRVLRPTRHPRPHHVAIAAAPVP